MTSCRSSVWISFCCSIFLCAIANNVLAKDESKNQKNQAVQLSPVEVKASQILGAGAVDGYKAGESRSSTRTDTALINTPQSISVITQDQIKDQQISSIGEAVRYVPGVAVHQGENNRDQLVIRGNNTSADFFVDGGRDDAQYYRDLYNVDRIEVLKGPNAMAFGRGGSGGVVNRILKTADGNSVNQLILSGGSFNNRRFQADVGNKVNNKIALRLNGMYEDSGTFRDYGDLNRYGFNPTAAIKLGKNTKLDFGYEYLYDRRFNDRGIPSFGGVPYKTDPATFFGNPNQNDAHTRTNSVYGTVTHNFAPDLTLRNLTRYIDSNKFYQNVYASGPVTAGGTVPLQAYNNSIERGNFTNQTDLTKKFKTGSIGHTALAGMELTREKTKNFRNTGYFNGTSTTINVPVLDPITYAPISYSQSASDADSNSAVNVYALYLQDQIEINKYLQLIGGVRYDNFEQDYHDNRTGTNLNRTDEMLSPRAGVVVKPLDNLSFYGSYSVSFLPSSGDQFSTLNAQIQSLEPEKLTNYEIGSKWDVTKRLNLSAAIYELDRTNTRAPDPSVAGQYVTTGKTRMRGFELGATGKITNKWQIIGGYAFQDAVILNPVSTSTTNSASTPAGNKVALVPRNVITIWNKYDFTEKFAAGIGFISQSGQYASADNTVKLKAYNRFDGATYYTINPKYRLQLNVENLFNQKYFQTADNNNNLQPGSPQAFKVMLVANF